MSKTVEGVTVVDMEVLIRQARLQAFREAAEIARGEFTLPIDDWHNTKKHLFAAVAEAIAMAIEKLAEDKETIRKS